MPVLSPATSKLKAQLKMAINRLRLIQQRETAIAKQQRRNLAQLLEVGKEQTARIKVENVIREDINVELLEILELYCELLLARIGLLDQPECDPGLEEAVKTIIYTAQHTEVKELHQIREMLVRKFSREFAKDALENASNAVPERVMKKLSTEPPSAELVRLYLCEISRAYHVPFSELPPEEDEQDDEDGGSGGIAEKNDQIGEGDTEAPKSPIAVMAPSPTTDNLHPKLKLSEDTRPRPRPPQPKEDAELASLRERFEALRKR
uniref:ARAD1D21934p n=1 Tax=Blastobotrys adeninivorans TaxID=409370 RepID=A0A060TGA7_BLAAD